MKRLTSITLPLLVALLPLLIFLLAVNGAAQSQEQPLPQSLAQQQVGVTELTSSPDGLSFTLSTPELLLAADGGLQAGALDQFTNQPGEPKLPFFETLIALPPEGRAIVTVQELQTDIIDGAIIPPVPHLQLVDDLDVDSLETSTIDTGLSILQPDPNIYQKDAYYPEQLYQLSEPFYVRDLRLVRLALYPVRYNPVSKQLASVSGLKVNVSFSGSQDGLTEPATTVGDQHIRSLKEQIINYDYAQRWRGLPLAGQNAATSLPVGKDIYKIEVDENGIYELSYGDLQAAGMAVNSVDPRTFQMLYRGQPVAYQFAGDGDGKFEPTEKIRFYGWTFNGSRLERQFISQNVYWLWAGGTPDLISTTPSLPGGQVVDTYRANVTREPENYWFPTYTDQWDTFPNEPDAWYWDRLATRNIPLIVTYGITLEHPVLTGPDADFTVEFSSYDGTSSDINHTAVVSMNDHPNSASQTWAGERNLNLSNSVPSNSLIDGLNEIQVWATSAYPNPNPQCRPCIMLNRITVDYQRKLIAGGDQLIFGDEIGGLRAFRVKGFSQNNPNQILIWDISNPRLPVSVPANTIQITGSGSYTYTFATDHPAGSDFIATIKSNILKPLAISKYDSVDLDPAAGGADWVAISYGDFVTETARLADHRSGSQFGALSTHVVDVEDVINQYGYGLPIPAAIQDYLAHALNDWTIKPSYGLLIGDATRDPRHLNEEWTDEQFVMADLVFEDPWQGQIPSDLTFARLAGDDIYPDISIGRIPVTNTNDLSVVIDKIILYDSNQLQSYGWMENFLFVSDKEDPGGTFCLQNDALIKKLPQIVDPILLCRDDYSAFPGFTPHEYYTDYLDLRASFFNHINNTGVTMVNYRGHGAIQSWDSIISTRYGIMVEFLNTTRPVVVVTGDCLDGQFTSPVNQGLGETLVRASNDAGEGVAAAAHWGSTGLGLSPNHSALIGYFYDGLFSQGLTAVGDAATYAKIKFGHVAGDYDSLLYSFTLQGDPAMQLMRPSLKQTNKVLPSSAEPGDLVTYTLKTVNYGVYPSHVKVRLDLPKGFQYKSHAATVNTSVSMDGNDVIFDLQVGAGPRNKGLPRNSTAQITVVAQVGNAAKEGKNNARATAIGTGLEALPGNESAVASVMVSKPSYPSFLPIVIR